jgi:transposase
VPDDHILVRVDRNLDLAWLRGEVADVYCCDNGRPGIDPEVAVRLMLAGLLLGIVHDRRLMREAQVNLAIRWFIGYGLHETLPDHSSLTRIRQCWGAERFKAILTRSAQACVAATIATGEVVHIDASLIRADVTWDALVAAHADQVEAAHQDSRIKKATRPRRLHPGRPAQGDGFAELIRMLPWPRDARTGPLNPPTSSTQLLMRVRGDPRRDGHNRRCPRHDHG